MKKLLLLYWVNLFFIVKAVAFVNPFACTREYKALALQVSDELGDVELVGIIGMQDELRAILQHRDHIHTLRVGESVSDVTVREISTTSVRVLYKNKELLLTVKDE